MQNLNLVVYIQMQEIRFGLQDGLNVSIYAKPEFTYEEMKMLRLSLSN